MDRGRVTRRRALAGSLGVTLGGGPLKAAQDLTNTHPQTLIRYERLVSRFAEPRTVWVWLPPGYETSDQRYPVIYMHDGQNVFSPLHAFRGQEWGMDEAITQGARTGRFPAAIVVGIANITRRAQDYAPGGILAALPDPVRKRVEKENGGPPLGDGYLRMIVEDIKPMIDANYRTKPGKDDTILMGASRGGMISLYGMCEYPEVFGKAGCLSTHWLLLSAPREHSDPNLETAAIIAAHETYLRAKLPEPGRHKVWMDRGTINLDRYYPSYQDAIDAVFVRQGWTRGQHFDSRIYDGADHNEAAWRARLYDPLEFLL
jgi:predicted alpha/beta superfamily hydrolase